MRTIPAVLASALLVTTALARAWAQGGLPPQPSANPPPRIPDASRPLIPEIEPALTYEAGAGALGYMSGAAGVGPAWNVRVSAKVNDRWAIEGNYLGSVNRRPMADTNLVMTSFDGSVRYNILRAEETPVLPYVTAGLGYTAFAGRGGDLATLTLPIAAGGERMLTKSIKIGARIQYRPAFFDNLGLVEGGEQPGGDTWSILAHLGGTF